MYSPLFDGRYQSSWTMIPLTSQSTWNYTTTTLSWTITANCRTTTSRMAINSCSRSVYGLRHPFEFVGRTNWSGNLFDDSCQNFFEQKIHLWKRFQVDQLDRYCHYHLLRMSWSLWRMSLEQNRYWSIVCECVLPWSAFEANNVIAGARTLPGRIRLRAVLFCMDFTSFSAIC